MSQPASSGTSETAGGSASSHVQAALRARYANDNNKLRILDIVIHDSKQRGTPDILSSIPTVNSEIIDISQLFMVTMSKGGYDQCNASKLWGEVAHAMGYSNTAESAVVDALRDTYAKVFLSFERRMNASKKRTRDGAPAPAATTASAAPTTAVAQPGQALPATAHTAALAPAAAVPTTAGNTTILPLQNHQVVQPRVAPAQPISGIVSPTPHVPGGATATLSGAAAASSYLSNLNSNKKARPSIGGRSADAPVAANAVPAEKPREALLAALVKKRPDKELMPEVVQQLGSKSVPDIVKAINVLMVRTTDADSEALLVEPYPALIMLLGDLLDQLNPLPVGYFNTDHFDIEESFLQLESNVVDWEFQSDLRNFQDFDENNLYLCCLSVLRNMSFEAANEPIIANSLPILSHLVYMLLSSPNNDHAMPECVSYSLDILSNVGRSLDMTGKRRRGLKEAWLCSVLEGDEAEQIRARCSRHYSLESTFLYCTASYLIFPRLFAFLRSNDREYILKALDCIGRLCHLQENVDLLNDCPESYPRLIVELLSVSTSCVEPAQVVTGRAEYDNALNFSSRPQALVAPMVELSDVAVRDMAVTALYWLVGLSLQWRRAVAAVPRSVELLRRIAVVVPRTESSARAVQVLIALSMDPANRADFLRCQPAMVASACCDEFIADSIFSSTGINFFTNTPLNAETTALPSASSERSFRLNMN